MCYSTLSVCLVGPRNTTIGCLERCARRLKFVQDSQHPIIIIRGPASPSNVKPTKRSSSQILSTTGRVVQGINNVVSGYFLERFLDIINQNPSVSKSNRLHVVIAQFVFSNMRYIP
jgi:hypothetical protein